MDHVRLLQPGDPLPPLPVAGGVLRGTSWPGQWALLVLASGAALAAWRPPAGLPLALVPLDADDAVSGAVWVQRLAARAEPWQGALAVLVEPRGTVAGAWRGADPVAAVAPALAAWQASGAAG